MTLPGEIITGLMAAVGIGLLIGLERERRRAAGGGRSPGGMRTFALGATLGAVAFVIGGEMMLAIAVISAGVLVAASYMRSNDDDPGITTEMALLLTVLLGGLAVKEPALAAGIAVVVTVLLAARDLLHSFARNTLTEREVHDGLILATAALVIWPLLPDRPIGPFGAINLRSIWTLVVLVMSVGAAGYVATRLVGVKYGLPLLGFAAGFVSSTATIGSMGERAKAAPALLAPAVAGATLSTLATFMQMGLLLFALSPPVLVLLTPALICAGLTALLYGAIFTKSSLAEGSAQAPPLGRAFQPSSALILALVVAVILVLTAALNRWLGATGVLIGAGVAGFADAHAAATSVASLAAGGIITPEQAVYPILAGLTTNAVSKAVMAVTAGTPAFAVRVVPGLVLVIAAAWAGALFWVGA